jgi:hypothetical protein
MTVEDSYHDHLGGILRYDNPDASYAMIIGLRKL